MAAKAKGSKVSARDLPALGAANITGFQTFQGGERWMQQVDKRGLKINPEYSKMSMDDILERGGLNFPVYLVQTRYTSPVSGIEYPSDSYSVIRGDNDKELGKGFASGYYPISYPDMLNQFFQGAVELGNIPTRVVSFNDGAKGAIQLAMPEEYFVADRPHKTFLNFYSSHDGTYGVTMNTCDICIICGNTWRHSLADTTAKWTVKHTKNMQKKIEDIAPRIVNIQGVQKAYYKILNTAATVKVESDAVNEFIKLLIPDGKPNAQGKINQGPANQRELVHKAIGNTAADMNTSDITAYTVFQGILQYTADRTQNRNSDEQFAYIMNSDVNDLAWDWLKEAIK